MKTILKYKNEDNPYLDRTKLCTFSIISADRTYREMYRHACFVPLIRNNLTERMLSGEINYCKNSPVRKNIRQYIRFLNEEIGIKNYTKAGIGMETIFSSDVPAIIIMFCLVMIRQCSKSDISDGRVIDNVAFLKENYNIKNPFLLYFIAEGSLKLSKNKPYGARNGSGHSIATSIAQNKEHVKNFIGGFSNIPVPFLTSFKKGGRMTPCSKVLFGIKSDAVQYNRIPKYLAQYNNIDTNEVINTLIGEFDV